MRSGRVWAGAVLLSGLMAGSVAAGSPWPPQRLGPAQQWKGRFTYERNFASRSDACDFQGHEAMQGEISCSGDDLPHLRCSAQGTVGYAYVEKVGGDADGHLRQRTDAGEYSGTLSHHLNVVEQKGQGWRYDLGVDANVPIHYTEASGNGNSRSGSYLLDVAAGAEPAQFNPASGEIAFDRSKPVTEPGPQACGNTMHNGKTRFAVRLLAVR
jgi:hypothetical protein